MKSRSVAPFIIALIVQAITVAAPGAVDTSAHTTAPGGAVVQARTQILPASAVPRDWKHCDTVGNLNSRVTAVLYDEPDHPRQVDITVTGAHDAQWRPIDIDSVIVGYDNPPGRTTYVNILPKAPTGGGTGSAQWGSPRSIIQANGLRFVKVTTSAAWADVISASCLLHK